MRPEAPAVSRPPTDGWPRKRPAFSGVGTDDCLNLHGLLLMFVAVEAGTKLLDPNELSVYGNARDGT